MTSNGADCREVTVAGVGMQGPVEADPRSIPEIVLEAVDAALADAGLDHARIDATVTASVDLFDGLTASNIAVTEVVGAVMKPETRIAADGLLALVHALCELRAGACETVLVVAHCKPSMAPQRALVRWALDPVFLQPLGLDFHACAGLQACAVAGADATAPQRWAQLVAQRRRGSAGLRAPVSPVAVLASAVVSAPLREEMCAPSGDGACAVILRAGPDPRSKRAVRIVGAGYDLAPHSLGDREPAAWEGLARACRRAYTMAGIGAPAAAFDVAEPSCRFPHEEELFVAASGISAGTPRSPGGGLFAGYTPVAAGLSRLVAARDYLLDHAGARRALVHGAWGPAGQGQAVVVLEAAPA